jgi:hypothetical protein
MRHDNSTAEPTRREKRYPLAGLMPRGLGRLEAARYIGVSATTFDKAVRDRLMPRPFRLYGRLLWCRESLDAAVDALRDAQTPEDDRAEDSWADYQ